MKTWSPSLRRRFRALAEDVIRLDSPKSVALNFTITSVADEARALYAMTGEKRRPVPQHRKERAERKAERRDEDTRVREYVFLRDEYRCRACWSRENLELDHFLGRARDRRASACWVLCSDCHRSKTENKPSRRYWLVQFRDHIAGVDSVMATRIAALLALDAGKHPSGAKPLESAK